MRRLTLERTTLVVALVLAFAIAVRPAVDNDLWWHLRTGRWMVDHQAIFRHDVFSYTRAGAVRQPSDWLSQLGLYGTWAAAGLTGVALLTAGLATAGMALILRACEGPALLRGAVVTLAAAASSLFWSARPQMATFVLTALVVAVLTSLRRSDGRGAAKLWLLVPLFAVWSNLHLGWFYGLGVMWATVAGELVERLRRRPALPPAALRTLAAVAAACSLAVVANPVGPRIFGLVLTQVDVGRRFIEENQPTSIRDVAALPFYLMLGLVVTVLALRLRRVSLTDVFVVAGTAVAAQTSVRTVPLFATAAAPVLSHHVAALVAARRERGAAGCVPERNAGPSERPTGSAAVNAVLLAGVMAVAAVVATDRLSAANVDTTLRREFPVAATDWIRRNRPPGPMFNTFDSGGYLIWELPQYPVYIDGRADLYADDLPRYARLLAGTGWEEEFDRRTIRLALVDTDRPLAKAMTADPHWRVTHRDRRATVLVRQG